MRSDSRILITYSFDLDTDWLAFDSPFLYVLESFQTH